MKTSKARKRKKKKTNNKSYKGEAGVNLVPPESNPDLIPRSSITKKLKTKRKLRKQKEDCKVVEVIKHKAVKKPSKRNKYAYLIKSLNRTLETDSGKKVKLTCSNQSPSPNKKRKEILKTSDEKHENIIEDVPVLKKKRLRKRKRHRVKKSELGKTTNKKDPKKTKKLGSKKGSTAVKSLQTKNFVKNSCLKNTSPESQTSVANHQQDRDEHETSPKLDSRGKKKNRKKDASETVSETMVNNENNHKLTDSSEPLALTCKGGKKKHKMRGLTNGIAKEDYTLGKKRKNKNVEPDGSPREKKRKSHTESSLKENDMQAKSKVDKQDYCSAVAEAGDNDSRSNELRKKMVKKLNAARYCVVV